MVVRSYSPEAPRSPDIGIVMFNHFGSCVASDTGRDAQIAAHATRLHVIAADRPGSGFASPFQGDRLDRDYLGALSKLARTKILREVTALGLKYVIIAGRSAGGLAALMTTRTEQLPVRAAHAQEPIGWHYVEPSEGERQYNAYAKEQETLRANSPIVLPEPTDQTGWRKHLRTATILLTAPVDKQNNARVWAQPRAQMAAYGIAREQPDVLLDIYFAEHSLALSNDDPANLQTHLREAGTMRADPNSIIVEQVLRTTHGSFDLRSLSNGLLNRTVERVLV